MATDLKYIGERLPALRLAPNELVAEYADPRTRNPPYFVRGRDPELAHLARLVRSMPNSVRAIVGPPGCGKSTLLTYLAVYALRHGYDVVELEPDDFRSAELLVKRIRPEQLTTTTEGRTYDGKVDIVVAEAGTAKFTSVSETMVASITGAVRERAQASKNGLVVLLDEFQNLARADVHARELAGCFVNYMHSSVPKSSGFEDGQIPAICIAAGLLNLVESAHELGVTRLSVGDCIRLGPIAQRHAEQVIRDHLQVRGKKLPPLATASKADVTRIAESCEGYPHHLTNAGWKTQSLAQQARESGLQSITPQMVDEIIADTQQKKSELYDSRWATLDNKRERYAALIIANIVEAWSNRVPSPIIAAAMARVMKEFPPLTDEKIDDVRLIKRLQRAGVVEERTSSSKFPSRVKDLGEDGDDEREHFCMPIPSFARYIRARQKVVIAGIDTPYLGADLSQPGAMDEDPIPAWEWRDEIKREEVAKLPVTPPATSAIRRLIRNLTRV